MSTRVETPERVLHRLEWQVIRRLDGRLQGNYRTIFRGVGTDFHDLREYEPGDDVRHIDWNVTARMDTPFLRQYVEDRELTAWLLLDRSPSMGFGPIDRPKELVLTELATTFARLLTRGGNPVGAILFDSEVESTIQPRSGRNQVLALTRSLMQPPTARGAITDLAGPLEFALGAIRRRSLIVLLSDFITAPGWERPLLQLTERHEVVAIRLIDPREYELPDAGVIVVEDTETGEQLTVDSSDAEFRHRLREAGEAREAELRELTLRAGVDIYEVSTEDDLVPRPRPHRRVAEAAALMSLGSPWMLLLLAVVPLLVLAYVSALRRRGRRAARLASEGLVPTTAGRRPRRRHIPFALFAAGIALVVFGLARPTVNLPVPEREGTVILAFDVSNSMRAKDLEPSRIEAAKVAARAFVEKQPRTIKIGVVAFGDSAVTVLKPSSVKEDVLAAINRLSVSGGTSLGQGLFTSLSTIAGKPLKIDESALESDAGKVNIGFFGSSAIVLLSDGENTTRPDPLALAEVASTAGVHVHAIGVGTEQGTVVQVDGFSVATALDAGMLKEIADTTDGTYDQASDAAALTGIYKSIDLEFKTVKKPREVTALFSAAGGLLLVLGSALSILWLGRVV